MRLDRGRILLGTAVALVLVASGTLAVTKLGAKAPADQGKALAATSDALPSAPKTPDADTSSQSASKSSQSKPAPSPALSIDWSQLKRGDLALDLTIEPTCARRGKTVTATLKAVPGAYVSLIVGYSDGQSFGTWYAGPTAPDGTLIYPWVVPLDAAPGEGHVFAAGHDPATEHSGTVAAVFRVAGAKGC